MTEVERAQPSSITILGCGPSGGVPLIGCRCAVCASPEARNRRLRASALFTAGGKRLLVDSSPDLREQALAAGLTTVDAVIYTHAHADHLHGVDDLRSFNYHGGKVLPVYGTAATRGEVTARFAYAFEPHLPEYGWFRPGLEWHDLPDEPLTRQEVAGIPVTFFRQWHGGHLTTLGLRIGGMAYSTDVNRLDDEAFEALKGVDVWVVDCLSDRPMPTHAHLELALEWIRRVKPRLAVLTHMGHQLDYTTLSKQLPEGVIPAYDGLVLTEHEQAPTPELSLFTETLGLQI